MKKVEKAKKVVAKKAPASAKVSPSKSSTKKTSTAKTAAKPAAKKAVAKSAPAVAAKKTAVKTAAKKVAPAAKKAVAPAKTAKAAPKKETAKASTAAKTPVKAEKTATPKAKAAPAPKIVTTKAAAKPIIVKMPENQNAPKISGVISSKPVLAMAPQKAGNHTSVSAPTSMMKPVYRPIQVINKPLAPLQPVRQMAPIIKEEEKVEFKKGDYVCYPAHGVGEIEAVESQTIGGMEIKLYAIAFEKDRMRLKVPVAKAHASGLRRLSSVGRMEDALKTLQGRAHVRRAMWSRRAQEYETKINSGDPVAIAEVLRDLKRSNDESEQSYSERQIYQSALERLAREVAAVERISEQEASERLENMIKGRRARAAATEKKEAVA